MMGRKVDETLEVRYAGDPRLLGLYQKNLPRAGWAGATDNVERRFVAATRRALGRRPRGRPFQPKTPVAAATPNAPEAILQVAQEGPLRPDDQVEQEHVEAA